MLFMIMYTIGYETMSNYKPKEPDFVIWTIVAQDIRATLALYRFKF